MYKTPTISPRKSIQFILFGFICLLFLGFNHSAISQDFSENKKSETKAPQLETRGDDYAPQSRDDQFKSPAYKYAIPGFTVVQVNTDESGLNILNDAGNEPSLTRDPNDPSRIAIGWRQFDNINNNFRQAGLAYSTDGGLTWTFPGVINPGIFRSDPVLDCDAEGDFYYNSLTVEGEDYLCDVFISNDCGATWDNGTFAQGGDKQWMTVDRSGGIGSGNIYAFWNASYSFCYPDFFTRSANGGQSYEDCVSIPEWPYWGTNTVNAEGELFTCGTTWSGNFSVAKSIDAQIPGAAITWDYVSNINLDGGLVGFGGYDCPNPSGLLGQTIIDVDRSGGSMHGNIYLLASVERYSENDPCDVMFTRSEDGGQTWSSPVRVNDDPGTNAYQWFGTMSVAPNGRIDVVWLDTRNNPGYVYSALYYANSLDGGVGWSENYQLSESFNPHVGWPNQEKMGDYFDMYSDEEGAHLAWAATFNGEQDVYYSLITPSFTGINNNHEELDLGLFQNYPNPFSSQTTIRFQIKEDCLVNLKVMDVAGQVIEILINEEESGGIHSVIFDASELKAGIYYYQIQAGKHIETRKMIVLD